MSDRDESASPLDLIAQLAARTIATDADVEFLVECLGHPRKPVQRRAAETLAAIAARRPNLTSVLSATLDDPHADLSHRWGAAYALGLIGPPPAAALATLIEVLGSDDGDLRWAAAGIIKRMRVPAVPELIRLTTTGNAAQRKMALYCLRDLDCRGAEAEAVAIAASDDADVGVRLAALAALPRLATTGAVAVAPVLRCVADPDAGVRRAAVSALGALGYRSPDVDRALHAAAGSADPSLRRAAERAMRMLAEAERSKRKAEGSQ